MLSNLACNFSVMLLCLFFAATPVCAEEFSAFGGLIENAQSGYGSYQWQLDYRAGLGEHFAYSISYLNEGHLPDHHRDGYGAQVWARANALDRRLSLAAGVGPYFYFDTIPNPNPAAT